MMAPRSIRDVSLVALVCFVSGCTFVQVAPRGNSGSQASAPKKKKKPVKKPTASKKPGKPAAKPPAAKPKPKPATPKPKPQPKPRPDPRPDPPAPEPEEPDQKTTKIVVPLRVGFAESVARIDSLVQKTLKQDWQTVSGKGAATKVEAKYTVWRDPIQASFDDGVLKVRVDVYYAADVRASITGPFGRQNWITKGVTWGTKSDPQKITAKFHAKFDIKDDFSVKAEVELDDIDHGEAPTGELCLKTLKVCVTKESIAPMVRKNLEKQLMPRIEKALNDADREVERALNVKKQAQTLWSQLQKPQSLQKLGQANCPSQVGAICSTPAWLVARPESIGVSQPRMDGKFLRADIAVGGQLAVELGDKPATKPTPLPKLETVTGPAGFAVRARMQLPLDLLNDEISRQLKDKKLGGRGAAELEVTRVTLSPSTNARQPRLLQLVLSVRGAVDGDLKMQGELEWNTKKGELYVKDFDFTVDSDNAALKQLSEANRDALRKLVAEKARWKINNRAATLGKAITDALGGVWRGHLDVNGELSKLQVESFSVVRDVLTADVVIGGQLDVVFTP